MKSLIFCLFFAPVYERFPADNWDHEMVEVQSKDKAGVLMSAKALYDDKWHELGQPVFWQQIMQLHKDTMLINVAETRQVLHKIAAADWNVKSDAQKKLFKDSLRTAHGLPETDRLMFTTGKNHFYRFDDVYASLSKGIVEFELNGVDPWYAQSILLIESPGQLLKSNVGAYGPFQLMPAVARSQGLTVNKTLDERADFKRSAYAASSFLKTVCIPSARSILNAKGISYSESDLWFRLFVMHVYHAGAGNIRKVVNTINPVQGGQELITTMWKTEVGGFGNASQNYTQIVLAAQMTLHEMISAESVKLFACEE